MALLAGCTRQDLLVDGTRQPGAASSPSVADTRAARALSVGDPMGLREATPFDRALRCTSSLDAIITRVREVGAVGLDPAQRANLAAVRAFYFRQLKNIGQEQGKSESALNADLAKLGADGGLMADRLRTALGCVRALQS